MTQEKIDQASPERIWAGTPSMCGNAFGDWDKIKGHDCGVEYISADLAAPSAPAEVEGLSDTQKIERMAELNWKPASEYWKEQHDVKVTALTALQAENERLRAVAPLDKENWEDYRNALARAEKAEAVADRLGAAVREIKEAWGWWREDSYDRCSSVVEDAISAAYEKLKGDV